MKDHRNHPREHHHEGHHEHGHRGRGGHPHPPGGHHTGGLFGGLRGRARRGEARFVLLDALQSGPKHGYEVIKSLGERSGGQYAPSPGTVYPTLQYLEDQALVRADQEAERRVYTLTDAGMVELAARADEIAAFWAQFAPDTKSEALQHEARFLQEELDSLGRAAWSIVPGGDTTAIRKIRQAIGQCRENIREIITQQTIAGDSHNAGTDA